MAEVRQMIGDGPVYISFDIDGIDPAFCPGTGLLESKLYLISTSKSTTISLQRLV